MTDTLHVEDFLDALSQLPFEVKRNLLLIRSLDRSTKEGTSELADAESRFLREAKRKLRERTDKDREIEPIKQVEDPALMADIGGKRQKCQQIADEKVAIADQTYDYVAAHLNRLKRNLSTMEDMLKNQGVQVGGAADAAAALASDQGGGAGGGGGAAAAAATARPVAYDVPVANNGDEVAVRPEPHDDLWVLARVREYDPSTGMYSVMDEDDNSKSFEVDESCLYLLAGNAVKLSKGEEVMAVYPDTTSFYRAVITQPPRRSTQIHSTQAAVQFADDADEATGVTPHRFVSVKHIMKLPTA